MFIFTNYLHVISKKYVTFSGRATRSEFWYFVLLSNIIFIAYLIASITFWMLAVNGSSLTIVSSNYISLELLNYILAIWTVGITIPSIAITFRRLHDTDKSGWWTLINLFPVIGPIIYIFLLANPSTEGENRFGPNPKPAPKL